MTLFDFSRKLVTPEWLTGVLKKNGFLDQGEVIFADQYIAPISTVVSTFYDLAIHYSDGSKGRMPSKALIKLSEAQYFAMGQNESRFYALAEKASDKDLPLVTCFAAEQSLEAKRCLLLLDDLRVTHKGPESGWPVLPPEEQRKKAIESLAEVHAYWWDHPSLANPALNSAKAWPQEWIQRSKSQFPKFAHSLESKLTEGQRNAYELLFEKLPEVMKKRFSGGGHYTILHGDAHFWNFLYPRDEKDRCCLIIDWQLWKIG